MDADTLYSAFLQCDEYVGTDKKMLRENFSALIEVMGLAILPLRVQQVMDERGLTRDDVGRLFGQPENTICIGHNILPHKKYINI